MKNNVRTGWQWSVAVLAIMLALAGCGSGGNNGGADNGAADKNAGNGGAAAETNGTKDAAGTEGGTGELTKVKVMLDWTPNTNHTGLYVARDKGFWRERGLDVEIVQPVEGTVEQLIASGDAEFGVSYQEQLTMARTQQVPVVSLAAVIQHNTSGFASPVDKNIKTPKDFEGKKYGGWGSPVEEAVIGSIMQSEGADVKKVKIVSTGATDFFTSVKRDIDFAWIYYAWTGVEAELRGEPINMVYLTDYSDKLDYYTPVLATSEKMIADKPDIVRAFVEGAAEGYNFAIDNPEEAADVLIAAVPDLNKELVKASQKWLAPKYRDDAARWGEQKLEVWTNYADWMTEHKLLEGEFDPQKAFTNDFLPQ
ncbi:ABC transporter substrate-binding protein [Paenibacillus darwinianus]|uniref:ABC transporter substrate-binding protein n=1 Tax=Paenibacillus darwinianus TaxID=1380763 RepID=A0A9W5W671_9BACL|nr:ABC transporter substrate-binding protein [Paenibacillus darwinianus]EXX84620.1 ABC transporter substrate-binding protein [Paenibacillus darwinianus]EXX84981.1 ABC transporter substrate-binding protein [Paenibacillus darwinianus]EXX85395.1 ABC transporter substrate-binding protein [Paenibacillus darwinianus]